MANSAGALYILVSLIIVLPVRYVEAVSGIYVNNHKIDKFEADRVKLLVAPPDAHESSSYVGKHELLTKDNFTNVQQYYQYLVGENPVRYIDLLWGKNKTQLPSIFRVGGAASNPASGGSLARPPLNYSDDQSTIKNTLNNTNFAYFGDHQRPPTTQSTLVATLSPLQAISTTRKPTKPPRRRRKKKPTPSGTLSSNRVSLPAGLGGGATDLSKTELTPETLSLLSRYYSFSCTLTPLQPAPLAYPTSSTPPPVSTTRRTKTHYFTTKSTPSTSTTKRPRPGTPATTVKQKKPVVYVDPPVIKRLGGMLESVYTFMENALTSTEYVEDSEETRAAKERTLRNATWSEPAKSSKSSKVKRNTYTKVSASDSDFVYSNSEDVDGSTRVSLPADTDQTWLPLTSDDGTSSITKQFTPKLVTISGLPSTISTDGNKNKMTTNIQVTSEYTAATPPTVTLGKPSPGDDSSADYDESSDEDSEEDYFEGFGGFDEVDEDEEDDEDDEDDEENGEQYGSSEPVRPNRQTALSNDKDYDETGTHLERPVRIKRVKKRRRKKRPATSYEDSAEYSDEDSSDEEDEYEERDESIGEDDGEDEDDDYDSGESPDDAPGFFSRMFSSFGRFVQSLGFGGAARGTPEDYDDYGHRGARSTTPRVLSVRRRPTRSTSDMDERYPGGYVPEKSSPSWLAFPASYLGNDIEEEAETPTLETPAVASPTSAGWFDLMMPWDFFNPWTSEDSSVGEETQEEEMVIVSSTEQPPTSTSSSPVSGWFSQFFRASTSKSPPAATTPLPKPEQILSVLAQYVAQSAATTKRPLVTEPGPTTKQPDRTVLYTGYQLWRIFTHTDEHLQRLDDYRQSPEGIRLQWWSGSPSLLHPTDVLVPPGARADALREHLEEEGLRHEPVIRDVGQAIVYENPRLTRREQIELELLQGHPLTWYQYHRYTDIVKFLHHLQRRYPQRVQLLHIGRSYEGRPITVARVSFASSAKATQEHRDARRIKKGAKRRPAIFVEAGGQGHAWIGPSVATWLLNRLLELPETNGTTNHTDAGEWRLVHSHDWYILPVLNPDGYEYSHKYDRMWSKTRSNQTQTTASGVGQALLSSAINWWNAHKPQLAEESLAPRDDDCFGVDLNRNWAYRWQQASEPIFRSPCSDSFAGIQPFSEPETRAVRDFLQTRRRNVRLYLSLQAYGQLLTYPDTDSAATVERYGPDALSDVHEMAAAGLDAMRTEAGEFLYSIEPEAGPTAYGTAAGYARYGAGIRYSYTLRLPDRGTHGFLLPPSSIVPIGRDVYELLKGMIDFS
uniref:Peptidase M14 domain-containing protein n=1 Tax=Anopheles epiroticus TaxID=199890 RepID=A0A182P7V5_9DIPT